MKTRIGLFAVSVGVTSVLAAACGGRHNGGSPTPTPSATPGTPVISVLVPDHGALGTSFLVQGSGFGSAQGASTITLGAVTATVSAWSNTEIAATVPATLDLSPVPVIVTASGASSLPATFRITMPRVVYVHTDDSVIPSTIAAYAISEAGILTALPGSPWSTGATSAGFGGDAQMLQIDRTHRRLFASNKLSVAVFDIDKVTGRLTAVPGSPFLDGGTGSYGIVLNSAGTLAFVGNCNSVNVSSLAIGSSGALAAISGSPFAATGCPDVGFLMRGEKYLYFNDDSSSLAGYAVNSTGGLSVLSGFPFLTPAGSVFGGISNPAHTQIYYPDGNGALFVFDVNGGNGTLSQIPGSPFAASYGPNGLAFGAGGTRLYAARYAGQAVYQYDVSGNGALAIAATSFAPSFAGISSLAVASDDKFLAAADEQGNAVGIFVIGSSGFPHPIGTPFLTGVMNGSPSGIVITP